MERLDAFRSFPWDFFFDEPSVRLDKLGLRRGSAGEQSWVSFLCELVAHRPKRLGLVRLEAPLSKVLKLLHELSVETSSDTDRLNLDL